MNEKNVVLVTGASSGIGKSTVHELLKEGFIVYGAARRVEKMAELEKAGAKIISLDLTEDDSIVGAVDTVMKDQGRIDVLVNNAGYGSFGSLEDTPIDEARRQYEVNLFGLGRLIQLVLPQMRERGSGKIINISSTGGKHATPFGGWYQSTKFALEGLSDGLRMDVSRFGIDVVVIEPGAIESEWTSHAFGHLKKVSSKPYAEAAEKAVAALEDNYKDASDPKVIADVILEAIKAKKPKTRYAAGSKAKLLLFMKNILSDRAFDKLLLKRTGIA
jgi:short-subunit dehydrogenase